jgi:hypothetical protein
LLLVGGITLWAQWWTNRRATEACELEKKPGYELEGRLKLAWLLIFVSLGGFLAVVVASVYSLMAEPGARTKSSQTLCFVLALFSLSVWYSAILVAGISNFV